MMDGIYIKGIEDTQHRLGNDTVPIFVYYKADQFREVCNSAC